MTTTHPPPPQLVSIRPADHGRLVATLHIGDATHAVTVTAAVLGSYARMQRAILAATGAYWRLPWIEESPRQRLAWAEELERLLRDDRRAIT